MIYSSHQTHSPLLLELLGSSRIRHQDSRMPLQHPRLNQHWSGYHLQLPLPHQLLQILADGILTIIRSMGNKIC